jgi:hypothetical protein
MGLAEDDEVVTFVSARTRFAYNTTGKTLLDDLGIGLPGKGSTDVNAALKAVREVEPSSDLAMAELIFYWKTPGSMKLYDNGNKTTLKNRPLWKLFPTRADARIGATGAEFVIWRWHDYYYDTNSPRADSYVGWHLNVQEKGKYRKPEFLPLERERKKFNQPDKIWPSIVQALRQPDRVAFANIEPPEVRLRAYVAGKEAPGPVRITNEKLEFDLSVRPHGTDKEQQISRVMLVLNDFRANEKLEIPKPDPKTGLQVAKLEIPLKELRHGKNRITLMAVNEDGGRGEATFDVVYDKLKPTDKVRLFALCVGVNKYKAVQPAGWFGNLRCPENDAAELAEVFQDQNNTPLYKSVEVKKLLGEEVKVTRTLILDNLRQLARTAGPDDWLVVFLAGHGNVKYNDKDNPVPETFYFVPADANRKNDQSLLYGSELARELAKINCKKLLILDACHSGSLACSTLRSLMPDNIPILILVACQDSEESNEPLAGFGDHGLFTDALLDVLGRKKDPGKRIQPITGPEIAESLPKDVDLRLQKLAPGAQQIPQVYPPRGSERALDYMLYPVLCVKKK